MSAEGQQSAKMQYLAALVVNLLLVGYGMKAGWASPNTLLLTSDDTPLPSGKVTMEEASWITSLMPLGATIGNIIFGFVMKKFGRKKPLMCISIPMITSWTLILVAKDVIYLYVARLLHGLCIGGILLMVPVYLTEIASDRIRGFLGSTVLLVGQFAVVIVLIFGTFCSFQTPPIFVICISVVFVVSFSFFPETPIFLVKQNEIAAAEKSIRFYRGIRDTDQETLHKELEKIKDAVGSYKNCDDRSMKWSDLTTKPGSKAMTIGLVLAFVTQMSGCLAMLNYASHFFKQAGSSLSPNISTIIVGFIQFCGAFVMIFLVERAGRKMLYIASTMGATFGYLILFLYTLLKASGVNVEAFTWVPVVSLSFIVFIASFAISNLPFTVIGEIMPIQIKEFGVTVCISTISLFAFLTLKFLPMMIDLVGLHGCMILFAAVCLSCSLFIILLLPETKGRSYSEIMLLLQ